MAKRDVALIVLYNDNKEILLQIRPKSRLMPEEHFGFFGGGIEQGEQPVEAVRREALEELNYKLQDPELMLTQDFNGRDMGYDGFQYVFVEKYDQSQPLLQREGVAMQWLQAGSVNGVFMSNRDKETLPAIFNFLNSIK